MSVSDVYDLLVEGIALTLDYFTNTSKRIHLLYLLSSALLAYYIYRRTKVKGSFFSYILNPKVWLSKSAVVDYSLFFFNSFVKILLIAPYLIYGLYLGFHTTEFLTYQFGFPSFTLSPTQTLIFYTIALTLLGDFATYLVHFLLHRIPFLWEFHKIHHSATSLNPITQYRIHPVELIINNIRATLVFGLLLGVFDYLSEYQVSKLKFLGANVFSFAFLFFGANLRHSHVKLTYFDFLEYIFISPFQHQIHHSARPDHFNKNIGSKLAVWDWMFGTLVLSKSVNKLRFGLGSHSVAFYDSFLKNLYMPFKNIFVSFRRWLTG